MSYDYRSIPFSLRDLIESSNQFIIASKNPEPKDEPVAKLATWSNVFGSGGSVSLEVKIDGTRVDLSGIKVEDNSDVREVREALSEVLEEWNEDPRERWRELVKIQREKVLEFEKSQARKSAEKVARYEAGDWS